MATTYKEELVSIDQLLLDPNNFRFQDEFDYVRADPQRYAEPSVQERATKRIRSEGLTELKASIVSNGFLAVERLVVRPYSQRNDGSWLFLVLEGNRRAASLKWIKDDHEAGVAIPPDVLDVLDAVPVIVTESDEGEVTYLSIMGIRHVGGIKQWGGYQRAKLVGDLRDKHGLETNDVADRLGMTKHEVNRRYRALKALQQMEEDEDFGDFAGPSMYPLFHEAVSIPTVREWLGWSDAEAKFEDDDEIRRFYSLITPSVPDGEEDSTEREAKITTYAQVRDLRAILAHPEARTVLLDSNRSFGDALGVAKADELSSSWRTEVSEAIGALSSIGAFDLEGLTPEDIASLKSLGSVVDRVLGTHAKLTS
ncbi:hypothetical protein GCM10027404_18940 [Arthrobacter tumbae]|uniref:hypothetical protein n=1 Tax=Arthrobacter tumbae TaxID=163874 RepID=UPI00195AD236|nr:hypothetical protein [Arthrobacter tumbae]MBM7780938.1 hypothetical protein [Arthrobacter tumbae]